MTRWTAIVAFNHGRACKTRLAPLYSAEDCNALALAMARHVLEVLAAAPSVEQVMLVAPERPPLPCEWVRDGGRGLNAELAGVRAALAPGATLFIHADLPLLRPQDIEALLTAAAMSGAAIAPDVDGIGTNAIAMSDGRPFAPAFGVDSFAAHCAALPDAAIVETVGLGLDVDEPHSLHRALALGMRLPATVASPRP